MAKFQLAEFGRLVFDNQEFKEDLVIRTGGRPEPRGSRLVNHELSWEEMKHYIDENTRKVIVGTGFDGMLVVRPEAQEFLSARGIELVELKTPDAVEAYNNEPDKNVVTAIIHSTC